MCIKVEELELKDVVPGCEQGLLSCRRGGYSEEQMGCVRGVREPINNTVPQCVRDKQNTSEHVITDQLTSADARIQFEPQNV